MSALDFKSLALPHLEALYRTARRMTGRAAEAEDLVQQTYTEAFRSFRTLRDPACCKAWLFQILRHLWFHRRERDARLPVVEVGAPSNLEEEILASGFSDEVERALMSLPDDFRIAFLLVTVADLSYDEVAIAMECPIGTVRSRVARARVLLTAELSADAPAVRRRS